MLENKSKYVVGKIILLVGLVASLLVSIGLGSASISLGDSYRILAYKILGLGTIDNIDRGLVDIIWLIRLPRVLLALAVGMGLSLMGLVMQAIVKNPLADPYILGVSSGASLGATLAIVLGLGSFLGSNYIGLFAFLGAFISSILVLVISNIRGRADSTRLLLAGMALSTLASSLSSLIIYFGQNLDGIRTVSFWLMGSLAGASWDKVKLTLPLILISLGFFMSQHRILNLMLLGDSAALTLGVDLYKFRLGYLLLASLNIGLLVYGTGTIGFVGLLVPHLVRMIFGSNHRHIMSITGLLGGIFLIWMDVLARTLIPSSEIPIGILVSIVGAPIFIYLMVSRTYGFGGGVSGN